MLSRNFFVKYSIFGVFFVAFEIRAYPYFKSEDRKYYSLDTATNCSPEGTRKDWEVPTCTFSATNPSNFVTTCIRPGVIRIQGEYDIIKITCSASYPIDLRYFGIQPTEAMFTDFYKHIEPNTNRKNMTFHCETMIRSIEATFHYFNNPLRYLRNGEGNISRPVAYDYTRSGEFFVHGIVNESLGTTYHIFLEDAAKPSLLRNSKIKARLEGRNLVFPCLPSHFEAQMSLISLEGKISGKERIESDAAKGFTIPLSNSKSLRSYYGIYRCTLVMGNYTDSLDFKYPPDPAHRSWLLWGVDDLPAKKDSTTLEIKYNTQYSDDGDHMQILPRCLVGNISAPNTILIVYPVLDKTHADFAGDFVLPQHTNRSYMVQMGTEIDVFQRILTIKDGVNARVGNVLCMNGDEYMLTLWGIGLANELVTFPYKGEWKDFPHEMAEIKSAYALELKSHGPRDILYEDSELTFSCKIFNYTYTRPIIWYTKTANESIVEEFIDSKIQPYSYFTKKMPIDVVEVICAASLWHIPLFRNISMPLEITAGSPPKIVSKENSLTLRLDSKNQFLKCEAEGKPTPELFWQALDKNGIAVSNLPMQAILYFDDVELHNAGQYGCLAKNIYGTDYKIFDVKVEQESGFGHAYIFGIPTAVFLLTTVLAAIYIKYKKSEKVGLTKQEIEEFRKGLLADSEMNKVKTEKLEDDEAGVFAHEFSHLCPYTGEFEIPKSQFQIDRSSPLGNGAYGVVLKGIANGIPVAVKTTLKYAEKQYLKALLSELKIMIYLGKHEFIIQLKGAYTEQLNKGIVYIFVQYCSLGDLESYLKTNRAYYSPTATINCEENSQVRNCSGEIENDTKQFCYQDLIRWAKEIALGMEYMSKRQVIHGDLATRNILLTKERQIKITDFGLSRKLYAYTNYVKKNQEPLPWRWLSLESLRDMEFSSHSDIWSFGITAWEIFSLAEIPYPGYTWSLNFIAELENGLRMSRPKYADEMVYEGVMADCWHENPRQRPSFTVLVSRIEQCGLKPDNLLKYTNLRESLQSQGKTNSVTVSETKYDDLKYQNERIENSKSIEMSNYSNTNNTNTNTNYCNYMYSDTGKNIA